MATYGVKIRRSDDLKLPPHPHSCTHDTVAGWAAEQHKLGHRLAVDLFAGAGGLSLGLQNAGWTVAASVDTNPKSIATHRHNFPGLALQCDLSDRNVRNNLVRQLLAIGPIDLLAGGPPCQPFSRAGRSKIRSLVNEGLRDAVDPRRELWRAYLHVAIRLRPRAVLMENVPDMALGDEFLAVRTMVEELEKANYCTQLRLVDARAYGVPQHRKRLILLARRDVDEFFWPDPVSVDTTLHDSIGDLPPLVGEMGARETPYVKPDNLPTFALTMRDGADEDRVFDHMTRAVRDDDREIFAMMDPRTLYSDIPKELRRYDADSFDDKYKRLDWNNVSRSITAHIAKDGYWYIHPQELRTLTVREAARIQTFPDRFRFAGTRSDAFRQIGNAVPPLLGEAAARALQPSDDHEAPGDAESPTSTSPLRPRTRVARQALARWAERARSSDKWYLFPGPDVGLPAALLSAVLTSRVSEARGTATAMQHVRGQQQLNADDLLRIEMSLFSPAARSAVRRAEPLTTADTAAWARWAKEPADLAVELGLPAAQTNLLLMLAGQDVMLDNQAAIRVAARFAGSRSAVTNRLTDGRTDLAALVGAGTRAPLRMAALRAVGVTLCRETTQVCDECPLRTWCAYRQATAAGDVCAQANTPPDAQVVPV